MCTWSPDVVSSCWCIIVIVRQNTWRLRVHLGETSVPGVGRCAGGAVAGAVGAPPGGLCGARSLGGTCACGAGAVGGAWSGACSEGGHQLESGGNSGAGGGAYEMEGEGEEAVGMGVAGRSCSHGAMAAYSSSACTSSSSRGSRVPSGGQQPKLIHISLMQHKRRRAAGPAVLAPSAPRLDANDILAGLSRFFVLEMSARRLFRRLPPLARGGRTGAEEFWPILCNCSEYQSTVEREKGKSEREVEEKKVVSGPGVAANLIPNRVTAFYGDERDTQRLQDSTKYKGVQPNFSREKRLASPPRRVIVAPPFGHRRITQIYLLYLGAVGRLDRTPVSCAPQLYPKRRRAPVLKRQSALELLGRLVLEGNAMSCHHARKDFIAVRLLVRSKENNGDLHQLGPDAVCSPRPPSLNLKKMKKGQALNSTITQTLGAAPVGEVLRTPITLPSIAQDSTGVWIDCTVLEHLAGATAARSVTQVHHLHHEEEEKEPQPNKHPASVRVFRPETNSNPIHHAGRNQLQLEGWLDQGFKFKPQLRVPRLRRRTARPRRTHSQTEGGCNYDTTEEG
ncbi:hypothetical protein C8F04DRAFT_1189467 [Mycena alexandri]|uniref:Uncharacterized protein n=1 Tax=Mycena alexandri TaxID=1745969 RepID=A0AAD6WWQ6_9AGAR|nr:hypothetical protein C8F04DRAFT_1189467 [Mycena alexandri]